MQPLGAHPDQILHDSYGFLGGSAVKNPPASAGVMGLIPG